MNRDDQLFIEFSEALYKTDSVDTMFSLLEKYLIGMGFDNVSYTFLPRVIATSKLSIAPVFKISKNYNQHFIQHYTDAGFDKQDFTIKRILQGNLAPMDWWQEARSKRLTDTERHVIQVARHEYQINNGVSLPTFTDGTSLAGVSLTSSEKDRNFNMLYEEKVACAHRFANAFSNRLLNQAKYHRYFYQPFTNRLSSTEKQVLIGLSKGLPLKTIAKDIGRDYKYISNFVINNLRHKFGKVSRDKLMFEAGANRFDQILTD